MTPDPVRDYLRAIGSKGGKALKGTEAAKIRAAKANEAKRRKKEAR